MRKIELASAVVVISFMFFSCRESLKQKGDIKYVNEIKSWHHKRIENLKKENGWLNLAGLFWLKEGDNIFGSKKSNDIVFPKGTCPDVIGKFVLKDSIVMVMINDNVDVFCDGKKIIETKMINDLKSNPTVLECGSLRWFIIKRGSKYGVRLRDLNSDLVNNFNDIETYPINSDWNIEADFVINNPPKVISVPNVLGTIEEEVSPGTLVFYKNSEKYKLDALDDGDSYFIIFADETSGKDTYGGGRFLYVTKSGANEKIFIDFNKAYNPPCSFTKYATCPLPPRQNHLKMEVLAGEKFSGHSEH